jgi:hypothetical protein
MSSESTGLPSFFQFQGKTVVDGLMEFELGGDLEDENLSLDEEPVDHELEISEADINGVPLSQDLDIDIEQYLNAKASGLDKASTPSSASAEVVSNSQPVSDAVNPSAYNAGKASALLKFLKGGDSSSTDALLVAEGGSDAPMQPPGPYPGFMPPMPMYGPYPFPFPPPQGMPFPPPPHGFPFPIPPGMPFPPPQGFPPFPMPMAMPPPNLQVPPPNLHPAPPAGAWSRPPPFFPPRPPPGSMPPPQLQPPAQPRDRVNPFEFLKKLPRGSMMRQEDVR